MAVASLVLPEVALLYMDMVRVSVWPGIEPATIAVAPNSAIARAQVIINPPIIPGFIKGKITLVNVNVDEAPSVLAANNIFLGMESMLLLAALIKKGDATKNWAIIIPFFVKMILNPESAKTFPIGASLLKNISRAIPATSGGITSGISSSVSRYFFPGNEYMEKVYATGKPNNTANVDAAKDVWRLTKTVWSIALFFDKE